MKLVSFVAEGRTRVGALLDGDRVVDLQTATDGTLPGDMILFLKGGRDALDRARTALSGLLPAGVVFDRAGVELLAPIPRPPKLLAIGMNFLDHAQEQNMTLDEWPQMFAKFPCTVIGPGAPIPMPGLSRGDLDYEIELSFVIGREARAVTEAEAPAHIAGWTIVNDVSARDVQFRPGPSQLMLGKNFTGCAPMGPCMVTADELPDPYNLRMITRVNGQVVQDSNSRQIVRKAAWLTAFLSRQFVLEVGDVITTGTPRGVGCFRNPPLWLKPGDLVECEVEGIGSLVNPVAAGV